MAVPSLTARQIGLLLLVAFCFHSFAYVLNDLIDLPLDRSQPDRALYPLVRGTIRPGWAAVWVGVQAPLALIATALLPEARNAYGWLLAAFVLLAVYDVWGKRTAVPPLTDALQGAGWGCLLLYGAASVGAVQRAPWLLFAFVLVYIMLVNGVSASLRDLTNDYAHGVRTTAIWLGVRPLPNNRLNVPRRFWVYALLLQVGLLVLAGVIMAGGGSVNRAGVSWLLACAILAAASFIWLGDMLWIQPGSGEKRPSYMLHILSLLSLLLALVYPLLAWRMWLLLGAVFVLPLLTADWFWDGRWRKI